LQDSRTIPQHVGIPESQHAIAFRRQPSIALNIALGFRVLTPVDLDDQASFVTSEIRNEGADWRLPPEAQSIQAMRSQRRP
jgi:hypothetical protein